MDCAFGIIWNSLVNVALIIVTASALIVYRFQKRDKKKEAARLIVIQIDNLISGIQDIASRISNGQLDHTAFYESVPLMEKDYWTKYRHVFIKDMSSHSINEIDKLFQHAKVIHDQQQVIAGLAKNHFFVVQQSLCNIEGQLLFASMADPQNTNTHRADMMLDLLKACGMPLSGSEQEVEIGKLLTQSFPVESSSSNLQAIETTFSGRKVLLERVYNDVGFTTYIPVQARISLERTINQCALLQTKATEGYRQLRRIAEYD